MISKKRGRHEEPRVRLRRSAQWDRLRPLLDSSIRCIRKVCHIGYQFLKRMTLRQSTMFLALAVGLICVVSLILLFLPSRPDELSLDQPLLNQSETDLPALSVPSAEPVSVTREQADHLRYTDSVLGELCWELTNESLAELNRVLTRYEIDSPEEIAQFLAQATVESGAGAYLTELGSDEYFQERGYSSGTRGAGYLHLTHDYGQMAFAVWEMKEYVSELSGIVYRNPLNSSRESVADAYYDALQYAANLGVDVSRYSRIVYDAGSPVATGAEYIATVFAWESAGYYWCVTGVDEAFSPQPGVENTDVATWRIGGKNAQSRREAYLAFYPIFSG